MTPSSLPFSRQGYSMVLYLGSPVINYLNGDTLT